MLWAAEESLAERSRAAGLAFACGLASVFFTTFGSRDESFRVVIAVVVADRQRRLFRIDFLFFKIFQPL